MGARDGSAERLHQGTVCLEVNPTQRICSCRMFVILLEVLKTGLGERQLFHSDIPPRPETSYCLRRVVQAQKGFSAAREVPLMTDAM